MSWLLVLRGNQKVYRDDSRFAPSQWETALLCNDISHWLGASLESAMVYYHLFYKCSPRFFFQTLMDRRIKPWVNKKIVEYIGEEEPTLTDFICQKVMGNSSPQMILNDIAMVSIQWGQSPCSRNGTWLGVLFRGILEFYFSGLLLHSIKSVI